MIAEKLNEVLREKASGVWKPAGFRASEAGYLCAKYQFHCRRDWDHRPTPDDGLAGVFALGAALEEYAARVLAEAGFRLIKAQVAGQDRQMDLVGHIDGFVTVGGREVPVEIKSASQWVWEAVTSWRDLATANKPWLRAWAAQLPLYMWMHGHEEGLYLLINKQTGLFKEVGVSLDDAMPLLEEVDRVLQEARAALTANEPPEPAPKDPIFCTTCWVRQVGLCQGVAGLPRVEGVDMAAVEEAAATVARLKEAAKEYEAAQKALSAALKAVQVEPGQKTEFFAGPIVVRLSCYETTRYEIPEDIRRQFAIKVPQRKVEVLA